MEDLRAFFNNFFVRDPFDSRAYLLEMYNLKLTRIPLDKFQFLFVFCLCDPDKDVVF